MAPSLENRIISSSSTMMTLAAVEVATSMDDRRQWFRFFVVFFGTHRRSGPIKFQLKWNWCAATVWQDRRSICFVCSYRNCMCRILWTLDGGAATGSNETECHVNGCACVCAVLSFDGWLCRVRLFSFPFQHRRRLRRRRFHFAHTFRVSSVCRNIHHSTCAMCMRTILRLLLRFVLWVFSPRVFFFFLSFLITVTPPDYWAVYLCYRCCCCLCCRCWSPHFMSWIEWHVAVYVRAECCCVCVGISFCVGA